MNRPSLALAAIAFAAPALMTPAASAGYLPYRVLVIDFGGTPGAIGQPVTWTAPGNASPYRHPLGGIVPPTADLIDAVPAVRWDDYFMIDPNGPSAGGDPTIEGDGHSALAPSGSLGLSFGPGAIAGVQYAVGAVGGRYASEEGRMYFASFTLPAAASTPTTLGMYVSIFEDGAPDANESRDFKFGADAAQYVGPLFGSGSLPRSARRYYLDWTATPVPASALTGNFGDAVNYTLFIQQEITTLPTPGVAGTVALALLCAARRRR